MKHIFSYNLNGIRAALRKGFYDWFKAQMPDVLCIQETKAQGHQIEKQLFEQLGYHCYSFSAQKKGYSGVALFSKEKPLALKTGIGIEKYDAEGRLILAEFENFTLVNAYHPSGTTGGPRQDFKMQWLADFRQFIDSIKDEHPELVVSGDFNICHKPIDINHPERHKKSSGFLPEERQWFSEFLDGGFIDSFRYFNSAPNHYSWWSYRAQSREKNLGWRIDYHLVSQSLEAQLRGAKIHTDAYHSDHCPIEVILNL